MKKHTSLLICCAALLTLASCNDWLDVKPSTQLDREKLFTTENGYSEAIKGVYSTMSGTSLYGQHMTWGAMEVFGGNYATLGTPELYNALRQYAFLKDDYYNTEVVGVLDGIWGGMYNAISGLNSILGSIDKQQGVFTGDNYSIIKGEAIGLRAFLHFELQRMFAEGYEASRTKPAVPFVADLSMMVSPLLTGEQMMALVISQLEEAVALLEKDPMRLGERPSDVLASIPATSSSNHITEWHNRRFHFNYYAAKATLARAYLWKGDKAKALGTALEVIADQQTRFPWVLTNNLTTIELATAANQDRTFATEHIFALNITQLEEHMKGIMDNLSGNSNGRLVSMRNMFTDSEQAADPRYRYMYVMAGQDALLSKLYQIANVSAYFKLRVPLIRISEMYYIAAECTADWQQGLEYLETVRRQRGLISLPLVGVNNKESLQAEIFREYRKEFIGEGQLWFYYKRHQAPTIVNMPLFDDLRMYTFPRPENEELYGNRN